MLDVYTSANYAKINIDYHACLSHIYPFHDTSLIDTYRHKRLVSLIFSFSRFFFVLASH